MDYNLAKKLKDAGFLQTWPQDDYMEIHDAIIVSKILEKYKRDVYRPNLSELIEACQKSSKKVQGFSALHSVVAGYRADGGADCDDDCGNDECVGSHYFEELGLTPEEAVAKLWLELNKTKEQE